MFITCWMQSTASGIPAPFFIHIQHCWCYAASSWNNFIPVLSACRRFQSFRILNDIAIRKNCVSVFCFPRVRKGLNDISCLITPNAPSTCMDRFIRSKTPFSETILSYDSRLSSSNGCDTFISRRSYVDLWHLSLCGQPAQLSFWYTLLWIS